ncbi:MAG: hypothetical protein R3D57_12175 [Hyphomicrobiaceae bacterium]
MSTLLAVSSSDQAAGCLRRSGVAEDVLAWFDPLHIGPVSQSQDLDALSRRRSGYFQLQSFGFSRIGLDYFLARNEILADAAASSDLLLVFQDNLLDQLQLLQVLDTLANLPERTGRLQVVHVKGFIDELTETATLALAEHAVDVTSDTFDVARAAWEAYRQPTPEAWADLAAFDTSALPSLGPAIRRALEELPDARSGLSRSQRQILDLLRRQSLTPRDLYRSHFSFEYNSHLEDWVFYAILDGLADGAYPLIEGKSDVAFNPGMALIDWRRYVLPAMKLTSYGQAVWRGEVDDRKHNGTDHWWGGTHLTDGKVWRWDARGGALLAPGTAAQAAAAAPERDPQNAEAVSEMSETAA